MRVILHVHLTMSSLATQITLVLCCIKMCTICLEPDRGRFLDSLNRYFVSDQCADVVDAVSTRELEAMANENIQGTYRIIVGLSKLRPQPCTRTS